MKITSRLEREGWRLLTQDRDNWKARALALRAAIDRTLREQAHLADGNVCTLIVLKRAIATDNKEAK